MCISLPGDTALFLNKKWPGTECVQDTLRLLKDKKSLKALLESHKLRDENKNIKAKSVEEAFYDLQD